MDQSNDMISMARIFWKWRKAIISVTAIAAIASVIISLTMMPNYYKSSVTFYPSNPTMTDRAILFSENGADNNMLDYFGGNSDIDRILTLANTSSTIDYIINKYKLYEHYEYDTTKSDWRYKTKKKFNKNYNTQKTPLGAVELAVWDTDKELASEIANHLAEMIDEKNKAMISRDKMEVIKIFEKQLKTRLEKVDEITHKLDTLRSDGKAGEDELKVWEAQLEDALIEMNSTNKLFEQYSTSASSNFSTIHITEPAYPALRKDKPKRSLVVIGYTLTAFFLMLVIALITEQYRKIRPQLDEVG